MAEDLKLDKMAMIKQEIYQLLAKVKREKVCSLGDQIVRDEVAS